MDPIDSVRERKVFSVLVIITFLGGAFFLIFIQYISSNYIDELLKQNSQLATENLSLTQRDQLYTAEKNEIQKNNILKKDASAIPHTKESDILILNDRIAFNANLARKFLPYALLFIFCVGAVLCWFILWQLRQLNHLVIKLDLAEKTALESVVIKENFLANMSHEIRTPLNAILGFTNIIQRRDIDPEITKFATAIDQSGQNLLRIVNEILDLSKIEAGMMEIIKTPFQLTSVIKSVVSLFSQNEKGIELTTTVDSKVPELILGDALRLTQILVNLVGNAIKFSSDGEIKIVVSVEKKEQQTIFLAFQVIDNGIGIAPEKLDLIFDRFRQAEESITRQYGGTGLGLSIVKNLIQLQHGSISAKSQPQKGTEILFTIPYEMANETKVLQPIVTTQSTTINSPMHLLVVEDNVMNQSFMEHLLAEWNFTFTTVADGQQAIDALLLEKFDAILMDIQMPVLDGYATTAYIRETIGSSVPIIAMTAHTMQGEKEKCLSNGMDAYISKPISPIELFKLLGQIVTQAVVDIDKIPEASIIPEYQYINLSYIKEVSNGSTAYERIITGQFIESIPSFLNALKIAFTNQDFISLNQTAHNMKTSIAIMGLLPKCGHLLILLETANSDDDNISVAIQELSKICDHAILEAKNFRDSLEF